MSSHPVDSEGAITTNLRNLSKPLFAPPFQYTMQQLQIDRGHRLEAHSQTLLEYTTLIERGGDRWCSDYQVNP